MLRPSYAELMEVLNKDSNENDEITSRYTIVIAAAKRARQIIDGDEPMVSEIKGKPLSTAVSELWNDKIKVVPEGEGTVLNLKKGNETEFDIREDILSDIMHKTAEMSAKKEEPLEESEEELNETDELNNEISDTTDVSYWDVTDVTFKIWIKITNK